MESKIILVRSSDKLIEKDLIGYGWKNVRFDDYENGKDLIKRGFKEKGIKYGRKRKQIELFKNITKGDIIVVSLNKAIAIGIAESEVFYEENTEGVPYSSNRIKVKFFRLKGSSKITRILRQELDTDLEQKLKIRHTIANLGDHRNEIKGIVKRLKEGGSYERSTIFAEKEAKAKTEFVANMQQRLKTGESLGIRAGGAGLEALIKEIFDAKGYTTFIPSKKSKNDKNDHIADTDVVAYKNGELGTKGELILIQAKHHKGTTSNHGIKQLEAVRDYSFGINGAFSEDDYIVKKILITTADKKEEGNTEISIINGSSFSAWLYENMFLLSKKTKQLLGISEIPTLI